MSGPVFSSGEWELQVPFRGSQLHSARLRGNGFQPECAAWGWGCWDVLSGTYLYTRTASTAWNALWCDWWHWQACRSRDRALRWGLACPRRCLFFAHSCQRPVVEACEHPGGVSSSTRQAEASGIFFPQFLTFFLILCIFPFSWQFISSLIC